MKQICLVRQNRRQVLVVEEERLQISSEGHLNGGELSNSLCIGNTLCARKDISDRPNSVVPVWTSGRLFLAYWHKHYNQYYDRDGQDS